jgi:hypothetical protein
MELVCRIFGWALVSACPSTPSHCELAVRHVAAALVSTDLQPVVAKCKREGLSIAQRDCILAAHGISMWDQIERCPAIVQRMPIWLHLPPRDDRRQAPPPAHMSKECRDNPLAKGCP